MKVYTMQSDRTLCKELQEELKRIRKKRNFNSKKYIEDKIKLLNNYMKQCRLKACVIAISGGIDSAITLALVKKASEQKNSPIKKILPLLLPCLNNSGVVNQEEATNRGEELCKVLGLNPIVIKMDSIVSEIDRKVEEAINIKKDDWAVGQLTPYSRTPVLYYTTSLLAKEGFPAIICGTTNLDEGGYLGYVGKASDGMVDVQLISDIHKSEVYQVAKSLNIPLSILNVTPAGDMYDNRSDEEVFGAPYDFVEIYLDYLNRTKRDQQDFLKNLTTLALNQFLFYQENLETLHSYNKHKYFSKSPAIHLDLFDSGIQGGWDNYRDVLRKIGL